MLYRSIESPARSRPESAAARRAMAWTLGAAARQVAGAGASTAWGNADRAVIAGSDRLGSHQGRAMAADQRHRQQLGEAAMEYQPPGPVHGQIQRRRPGLWHGRIARRRAGLSGQAVRQLA